MVSRGTIVLDAGSKTLNLVKEKVNLRTGLINKNIPTLSSDNAWQAAVWGRGREIILEGWFAGTQSQIELFISYFEDWLNSDTSFQETGKYYPMHHKANLLLPGEGYWNVMGSEFEYEYNEEEPSRIRYALVLREGTKLGQFNALAGDD